MGYVVKELKNRPRPWKVGFIWRDGEGKQRQRDVPEHEFSTLGFAPGMSIEDARRRRDQLNAQEAVKRHEKKRTAILTRLTREQEVLDAFLNSDDVSSFESEVLYSRVGDIDRLRRNKIESHWRVAKRLLSELKLDPSDWAPNSRRFYDYFYKNRLSPSYLQKVLYILNQWGTWHCRKYRRFFEPLQYPTGHERERIADRYFDKNERGMESDPLTPQALENAKGQLQPEHYNWLKLSVWFGLRPFEVDALHEASKWRLEKQGSVTVLFVYQSKLTSVPRDKRWKPIPCLYEPQKEALEVLKSGLFARPLVKTLKRLFTPNTGTYAGRKGFTDLMLSLGQKLEDISIWMGHMTVDRTWRNYKNRQAIRFTPV